ncbi:MAG: transglutaminase domain-containing protein [Planctomycetes bacterium]|nr:transglutaminase domain-containing protein [Planctomycetota bacterium]
MFEKKMGFNQAALIDDALTKRGVHLWLERVLGAYGEDGGVDIGIISGQLNLNDITREYIYDGDFTPKETGYVPGSRALLEATVESVIKAGMTDVQKVLAIMRRCRDNRDCGLKGGTWTGGSEEELLKRGAIMCNEISRVFVCLCQVAGIRARIMCSHISGHMMAEAEVEGQWWWVDPMQGCYCFKDNGKPASTWDLLKDPGLFERQAKSQLADVRPTGPFDEQCSQANEANVAFRMAKNRDCYFNRREAVAIGNYFACDKQKYTFPWFSQAADPARLFRARREEMENRKKMGWPDYYFNPYLFDETVKTQD